MRRVCSEIAGEDSEACVSNLVVFKILVLVSQFAQSSAYLPL